MIVTIKKGEHFSNKRFPFPFSGDEMVRYITFNETSEYKTVNKSNMDDVNKLVGFAEVGFLKLIAVFIKGIFGGGIFEDVHHFNSARIGFSRPNPDNKLWFTAYCYAGGVRQVELICEVDQRYEYKALILVGAYKYEFMVLSNNGFSTVGMTRGLSTKKASGFKLNAYMGGDEPASREVNISIRKSTNRELPKEFRPIKPMPLYSL